MDEPFRSEYGQSCWMGAEVRRRLASKWQLPLEWHVVFSSSLFKSLTYVHLSCDVSCDES